MRRNLLARRAPSGVPERDRLLHRRQFILGPRTVPPARAWPHAELGRGLLVHAHPDLALRTWRRPGLHLVLLGYLIDPDRPEARDEDLLAQLARSVDRADQVPLAAADLSGRFVLIAQDDHETIVSHDACGMREVYHTTIETDHPWVASQPVLIADHLELVVDDDARKGMLGTKFFLEHHEPWWPGDTTPYRQIRHLLPNHFLRVEKRRVERFWPNAPLRAVDPETAAQGAARRLRASVRAVQLRYPLALPITAGMDSRTVLAACREVEDLYCYTAKRHPLTNESPDIAVPRRMLRNVRRRHHAIACRSTMTEEFARIYRRNVTTTHDTAGAIAESLLASYPAGRISLSGHCSEIARDTFGVTHAPPTSVRDLASLMRMQDVEFALHHLGVWMEQARAAADATGHRLWDLYFWEQEHGNWAANGQSQWDLIHERFTPFDSRPILTTLLGVDPVHRQGPDYPLYRRIIEILWPDLLREPVNPVQRPWRNRLRHAVVTLTERTNTHGVARALIRAVRKRP